MSAVSMKLIPTSRAASTTARVAFASIRPPKLLPPRPTVVTSSDPIFRVSMRFFACRMHALMKFRRVFATSGSAVLLLLFFPLRSSAQDPSPFGRGTLSVMLVGGKNFAPGRHGLAESVLPTVEAGKFVSRRLEVGLDFHPWIGIRQPVNDNGDGGYKNVTAFALDVYGR